MYDFNVFLSYQRNTINFHFIKFIVEITLFNLYIAPFIVFLMPLEGKNEIIVLKIVSKKYSY